MNIRKHNGLTLLGFLIVLVVTLFFVYAGMRIIPMYLEYHALKNAMSVLEADPMAKSLTPLQIKQKIEDSLWASYAANNIKRDHMHISRKTGGIRVRVAYKVESPFFAQISLVGTFENEVVLN